MLSVSIKNSFLHLERTPSRHRRTISVPTSPSVSYYDDEVVEKASPTTSSTTDLSLSLSGSEVEFPMKHAGKFRPTPKSLEGMTTVMLRNIPCKYTQEYVMQEVSAVSPNYDFLYMPPARRDGGSKGYAFVNFCDEETASKFIAEFQGHTFYRQPNSQKRADVGYAEVQGLVKNVKFYKRCKAVKSKFHPYIDRDALRAAQ